MRIIGFCLMPNHFHLVLWPHGDGDLSRWMQWLLTAQVRRHHRHCHGSGHVWQGRFKAFPIEQDEHLATVLRYVERNPVRGNLVERAEQWRWSSLWHWQHPDAAADLLDAGPVPRGAKWLEWVNEPMTESEVERLRQSIRRNAPFGSETWTQATAERLGLQASLRPRGRPRKAKT